jgi:hypothetical protein
VSNEITGTEITGNNYALHQLVGARRENNNSAVLPFLNRTIKTPIKTLFLFISFYICTCFAKHVIVITDRGK